MAEPELHFEPLIDPADDECPNCGGRRGWRTGSRNGRGMKTHAMRALVRRLKNS